MENNEVLILKLNEVNRKNVFLTHSVIYEWEYSDDLHFHDSDM